MALKNSLSHNKTQVLVLLSSLSGGVDRVSSNLTGPLVTCGQSLGYFDVIVDIVPVTQCLHYSTSDLTVIGEGTDAYLRVVWLIGDKEQA